MALPEGPWVWEWGESFAWNQSALRVGLRLRLGG